MELAKKLILWVCLVVGVSIVCLAWRPITGDMRWTAAIRHGELVLVSVTLTASAVGYAAMVSVDGGLDFLKSLVVGVGLLVLVLSIGVYASYSDPSAPLAHSPRSVAKISYVLLATSVLIGIASTYLSHRGD